MATRRPSRSSSIATRTDSQIPATSCRSSARWITAASRSASGVQMSGFVDSSTLSVAAEFRFWGGALFVAGSFNPNVGPPPALSVVQSEGSFRGLTGGLAVTNTASGGNVFTFTLRCGSAEHDVRPPRDDHPGLCRGGLGRGQRRPCPPDIGAGLKNESPATAGLSHEALAWPTSIRHCRAAASALCR